MSDYIDSGADSDGRGSDSVGLLLPLEIETILEIENEAEERFRKSATELVTNNNWAEVLRRRSQPRPFKADSRQQQGELLLIIRSFARQYKRLLETAVVEFCRDIGEEWNRAGIPSNQRTRTLSGDTLASLSRPSPMVTMNRLGTDSLC